MQRNLFIKNNENVLFMKINKTQYLKIYKINKTNKTLIIYEM